MTFTALPARPTNSSLFTAGNSAVNSALTDDPDDLLAALPSRGGSANRFGAMGQDRNHPAAGLVFGDSHQPVTRERLITWAVKQGQSPDRLRASIESSHYFVGSEEDKKQTRQMLDENMDQIQAEIQRNRDDDRKLAEEEYQKKGAAREPLPGHNLITVKELQQLQEKPSFDEPLNTVHFATQRPVTYVKGQVVSEYTIVSARWGVVEKDGYYYQIGESGLDQLNYGYHPDQNLTTGRQVWERSGGINYAYGYALEAVGEAMQFAPALGRLMAPFIKKSGEGVVHDARAIDAKLAGEDFDEPEPEMGWDDLAEGVASAAAPEIGGKAERVAGKVLKPMLGRAAPYAGKVVGSVTGQYASHVIQNIPTLARGEASVADVAESGVSASGVAHDLAYGAAHHAAGKVAGKIAPGRNLSNAAPAQKPADSAKGAPPPHTQAPALEPPGGGKTESPRTEAPGQKPTGKTTPLQAEPQAQQPAGTAKAAPAVHASPPEAAPAQVGKKTPPARPGRRAGGGKSATAKPASPAGTAATEPHADEPKTARKAGKAKKPAPAGKTNTSAEPHPRADADERAAGRKDGKKATEAAQMARPETRGGGKGRVDPPTSADGRQTPHPEDPHWDDYQRVLDKRGFESGAGVGQHEGLKKSLSEIGRQEAPLTQRHQAELDALQREKTRRAERVKPLEKEVKSLRGKEKRRGLRSEEQSRLNELKPQLQQARAEREAVKRRITQVQNKSPAKAKERIRQKLALSRAQDPLHPDDPAVQNRGAIAGNRGDTHAVVRIVDSKTKEVVAWSIATFEAKPKIVKPENRLQAKRAEDAGSDRQEHAEEKSMPGIKAQLDSRGIKSLKGYSIEVVGDREVCEKHCQPMLTKIATRMDADQIDGYTYHGRTKAGRPLSEKETAVQRSTDVAEGMTYTKKQLKIYRRPVGGGQGGPAETSPPGPGPRPKTAAPQPEQRTRRTQADPTVPKPPTVKSQFEPAPSSPAAQTHDVPPAPKAPKQTSAQPPTEGQKITAAPRTGSEPPAEHAAAAPQAQAQPQARKAVPHPNDPEPKAAKSTAKAAAPEHAQPIVRQPGGAPTSNKATTPSHSPSSHGEKVTGALGKADAVLGAVRDYDQYRADGASKGSALARAGTTLAANLKGGPAATIVNAANAYDNARKSGQGKVEAAATALGSGAGGIIGSKIAPAGPVGTAVNLANTAAQALGAPQGVQDATAGAATLVPSNIVGTTVTEGARSYANIGTALVTGDAKALDKQVQGYQAGNAGPWLQGYAQMAGMVADMAAGDNFETALNKAADSGKGSWADRVGSASGDAMYELSQSKDAKAGKYGASVQGISMSLGVASDMIAGSSFEQALNKAADAGKGSWTEKVGNALGDVAWDATEKIKQLSDTDLPAAKQAIKDKWNKLWS
jgi:hypothetical protein